MVMRIKRYEGEEKDLPRIIRQIKRDLGENAVVKTRRYRKGGVLGVGGKPMVEVYAGIERDLNGSNGVNAPNGLTNDEVLERLLPKTGNGTNGIGTAHQSISPQAQSPVIYNPPGGSPVISTSPVESRTEVTKDLELQISRLAQDIADIRKTIQESVGVAPSVSTTEETDRQVLPRWLEHLRDKLIANEVSTEIADEMLHETLKACDPESLTDFEETLASFQRTITSNIEARGSIKGRQNPRMLALAGPTGVGKTTTLAKLAATANLLDKERVGLISADTYRIAAIDQLKTFAGILDIPIKVVFSPAEFREAIEYYSDMDRIFIDTAGRSPKNDDRINELRELIHTHEEVDCHLVVSATTRPVDMELVSERFRQADYTRFIFTKIDETTSLGPVLNLMYKEGLPASFLTNGQSVPDDIVLGEESDLINLVIRRSMS